MMVEGVCDGCAGRQPSFAGGSCIGLFASNASSSSSSSSDVTVTLKVVLVGTVDINATLDVTGGVGAGIEKDVSGAELRSVTSLSGSSKGPFWASTVAADVAGVSESEPSPRGLMAGAAVVLLFRLRKRPKRPLFRPWVESFSFVDAIDFSVFVSLSDGPDEELVVETDNVAVAAGFAKAAGASAVLIGSFAVGGSKIATDAGGGIGASNGAGGGAGGRAGDGVGNDPL